MHRAPPVAALRVGCASTHAVVWGVCVWAFQGEQKQCIKVDAQPMIQDLRLSNYRDLELSMADTLSELRRSPYYGFDDLLDD